jgi:EAL domain-containing protein (putative c-di-GMP-specific phosphodiesterase class I)
VAGHVVDALTRKLRQDSAKSASRQVLLERVRGVLEGDALAIAFQPIFSLPTRRLAGYEALARFRTELVQPTEAWFADAESVGLRVELELAAIARALAQISLLGEDTYLSLNASPDTLLSPELGVLLKRPLRPRIVLELTEHAQIENYDALAHALAPLRADGVRLAVDDAGAGFASLRHILQLDPDMIKIDRSLTKNLEHDSRVRALAAAIVTFARETGVIVVAEGIETAEQLNEVQALGAASAQGYLLGKPAFLETVTSQPFTTSVGRTGG